MPIAATELEALLKRAFPDSNIALEDLAGDNDHYKVTIISPLFAGKSRITQHRLVHEAIAGIDLHALAIETKIS